MTTKNSSTTGGVLGGKLPVIHSLCNYYDPISILVIGCGGTGAYVVSHLSRLISIENEKRAPLSKMRLYLADGDIVEEKNLSRQHFISQDIGMNKAEVLGERYSAVFGIEIGVIPKDIESVKDFGFLSHRSSGSCIIVGCVDNNASRKVIKEYIDSKRNYYYCGGIFWIDSGNEERNGQVVCGFVPQYSTKYNDPANPRLKVPVSGVFSLPFITEIYPDVLKSNDKFNSEVSCAERAQSAPQNMQTNVTSATITMNYLNKIIYKERIKSHCVEFSIDNNYSTKLNTPENLSVVSRDRRKTWER